MQILLDTKFAIVPDGTKRAASLPKIFDILFSNSIKNS